MSLVEKAAGRPGADLSLGRIGLDAARRFVHQHSIYKEDAAFYAILGDPVAIADRDR